MARARYASTVVLVRPNEHGGFDILLTRRPPQMRFLGGFYVFPGGTIHESDYSPRVLERCHRLSGDEARKILVIDMTTKSLWVIGLPSSGNSLKKLASFSA